MLKKETIETLLQVVEPLHKCGVIPEDEMEELRCLITADESDKIPDMEKNPLEDLQMFSVQRTARFLDRTVKGVYDLVNAGELELVKLGHRTSRITCSSIRKFVEKCRTKRGVSEMEIIK